MTLPSRILLEHGDGHACTQERSGSWGARTCASRWPWYCLPVFPQQAGPSGFGAGGRRCCLNPCGGGLLEWILCSAYFNINLLPLMEAWRWSVAASDHQRLRNRAENSAHNMPVGAARESDSSSQLVGSAPQQDRRTSGMGERTEARLVTCTGVARPRGRPPKSQGITVSGGGSDRGAPDSDGYSTASETGLPA